MAHHPCVAVTTVTSWTDARDYLLILGRQGRAFRGQANAEWPLESSLQRLIPSLDRSVQRDAERQLLALFKRDARKLLPPVLVPVEGNDHGWVGLMQHYGAPTRFMDFTRSPFVAAFFALETPSGSPFHAVWSIDIGWCAGEAASAVAKWRGVSFEEGLQLVEGWQATLVRDLVFAQSPPPTPFAFLTEPWITDERQTAQQALFLCPSHTGVPMTSCLFQPELSPLVPHVRVLRLAASMRAEALDELRYMNITRATLFPGLEGLGSSLRTALVGPSGPIGALMGAKTVPVDPQ